LAQLFISANGAAPTEEEIAAEFSSRIKKKSDQGELTVRKLRILR
jgi:hypothetical protein